jgi:hypothetical protein
MGAYEMNRHVLLQKINEINDDVVAMSLTTAAPGQHMDIHAQRSATTMLS